MNVTAKFSTDDLSAVSLSIAKDNGLVEEKMVSFTDFKAVLDASAIAGDSVRIGHLPKGFYDGTVSATNPLTFRTAIVVPAEVRPLMCYGETFLVPFPTLLFTFRVRNGFINRSCVYAVADKTVTDRSILYEYPYGNVYEDGHICWGGNALGRVPSCKALDKIVSLFFGSETNDDLYRNDEYPMQRALIMHVMKKKTFPKSLLKSKGLSVSGVLNYDKQ